MPDTRKPRSLRGDAMDGSVDPGKRLYDMYEAGPAGAGVPQAFLDLLVKLEAERDELEKKQDG